MIETEKDFDYDPYEMVRIVAYIIGAVIVGSAIGVYIAAKYIL